jgi:ethanolamine utilization protein EutP (predicted NTPase)
MKTVVFIMLVLCFINPSFRDLTYNTVHQKATQAVQFASSLLESTNEN